MPLSMLWVVVTAPRSSYMTGVSVSEQEREDKSNPRLAFTYILSSHGWARAAALPTNVSAHDNRTHLAIRLTITRRCALERTRAKKNRRIVPRRGLGAVSLNACDRCFSGLNCGGFTVNGARPGHSAAIRREVAAMSANRPLVIQGFFTAPKPRLAPLVAVVQASPAQRHGGADIIPLDATSLN